MILGRLAIVLQDTIEEIQPRWKSSKVDSSKVKPGGFREGFKGFHRKALREGSMGTMLALVWKKQVAVTLPKLHLSRALNISTTFVMNGQPRNKRETLRRK